MKLYIGNKNYSSWSLRAWLMVKKSGIKFDEILLQLDTDSFYQQLQSISPTLKVPTLVDGDITVWDSLSICEYINDSYLSGTAWPQDPKQKAKARSLACEMHSGFNALRNALPMNIRARRYVELSPAVQQDIARVDSIWSQQMAEFAPCQTQGTWLFGQWSIADMMFAPVVMRFFTYEIEVSQASRAYMEYIMSQPQMQAWITAAKAETEIVEADEAGVDR
ncbi:glutathione S-transferase family protein [Shewanella oneidensis MR-1]|uniref:Glutathione S-transferase family protein n=1 Tax=Shewanella oneidensis (strain ATCC 700550 / JCM 31522 / CIP 106686 / LMG 19005 / NCIMB 14063 / MR-1) TaxID=211586 RepID=Q8EKS8_SHEON|nr:glutathione S-transferase family protein [Shewanella oneidensis]AAN53099.1 glutathione S-transferase family protein [Shewanella oneidensis MR-1]MDX5997998.1 glutathione S-transferase family protein [Shewanella oneidensis]MEE2027702.1 Glutathione S-transferase YfcF [Shewanella oneidensis]QKG95001.1 glutathione S-transferase family protein [Shewanella oneidensis MR-1]